MFDVSPAEILTLAFIALLVFGPDRLPEMAAKAGRLVRQVRKMAESARADLTDQLGPEFKDLSLSDLQPRNLVRKHLLDGIDDDGDLRKSADLRQLGRDITGAAGLNDIGLSKKAIVGAAAPSGASVVANGAANGATNGATNGAASTAAAHEALAAPSSLPPAMQATEANAPAPYDTDAT